MDDQARKPINATMNEKWCGASGLGSRRRYDAVIFEYAIVKYTFRASVCLVISSSISVDRLDANTTFRHYLVGCSIESSSYCFTHTYPYMWHIASRIPLLLLRPLPPSLSERVSNKFQWIIIYMDFWRGQTEQHGRRIAVRRYSVCGIGDGMPRICEAHAHWQLALTPAHSLVFDQGLVINACHSPYI